MSRFVLRGALLTCPHLLRTNLNVIGLGCSLSSSPHRRRASRTNTPLQTVNGACLAVLGAVKC